MVATWLFRVVPFVHCPGRDFEARQVICQSTDVAASRGRVPTAARVSEDFEFCDKLPCLKTRVRRRCQYLADDVADGGDDVGNVEKVAWRYLTLILA